MDEKETKSNEAIDITALVQATRAIISAKYLPLLGAFRANDDDVRVYLQCLHIEPHEDAGAYLVATDGHRMVVVHDEEAQVDGSMLINPAKLIIRESKHAKLADFDGLNCDLQDEEEKFLMSAPAPRSEASYPDWRLIMPEGDISTEPGSIDPGLLAAISKAPFGDNSKNACIYIRQDKPCVVRFPSLPEIFVLIMPQRYPAMRSNPEWIGKRKRQPREEQMAFGLTSVNDVDAESEAD